MNKFKKILSILVLAVFTGSLLLCLISCDNFTKSERNNPLFIKGKNYKNNNRYSDSAKVFEEYLIINPKSAKTHQELANLYHDHLNEPLLAVYHYRQYLKYLPESKAQEAQTVSLWLQTAEKDYYSQLKDKYDDMAEIRSLKKGNMHLKDQNEKFKRYIKYLISQNRRLASMLNRQNKAIHDDLIDNAAKMTIDDVPSKGKMDQAKIYSTESGQKYTHYVVKKGDTLSKISTRFYGSPKYNKLIYEVNKKILPSLSKLSVDQKLVIPILSEKNKKE